MPTTERVKGDKSPEGRETACPPRCPVCAGPLVEQRRELRCERCYYTFCEGCGDGGERD